MKIHTKPGFTLIELLTVIAIIGILAAILIPTVGKVREQAQYNRTASNVRQWNTAMILHAQDNRGLLPHQGRVAGTEIAQAQQMEVTFNSAPGVVIPTWWNALPQYFNERTMAERAATGSLPRFGEQSVWVCPRAVNRGRGPAAAWLSYAPSVGLSDTNVAFAPNLYNISQPSRTPLFMESTNNSEFNTGGVNNAGGDWFLNVSPNFLATQNRWGGLRGKANVGFADGSVRSFTGQQLEQNGTAGAGTLARPNSVPPGQQWLGSTTGYHWRVFR